MRIFKRDSYIPATEYRARAVFLALAVIAVICPLIVAQPLPEGNACLKMNTTSDLDLHGYFPWGTHVWYGSLAGEPDHLRRGEYLTHDENVVSETAFVGAVERIYFPAHDGQYQFSVHNYRDRQSANNPYVLQVFFGHQNYTEVGNLGGTGSENNYYYTFYRQGNHLSRVGQAVIPDRALATGVQTQGNLVQAGYYGSPQQGTVSRQRTANDVLLENSKNPTGYSQTEAVRLGGTQEFENNAEDSIITGSRFATRVVEALFDFAKSMAGQNAIDEFTSLNQPGAYKIALETYEEHESAAGIAKDVGWILKGLKTGVNLGRVLTADAPDEFAAACNETVRDLVKIAGGVAGGALGGALATAAGLPSGPGAIVLGVGGKLLGDIVGSWAAGMAYDKWLAEDIKTASVDIYTQHIKSGSLLSNAIDTATMWAENAYGGP